MKAASHPCWHGTSALSILGSGHALPGCAITTDALLELVDEQFHLNLKKRGRVIAAKLGIETRHIARAFAARGESAIKGATNPELCVSALNHALADAHLAWGDIDYLIGHTTTPHTLLPSNIAHVAKLAEYQGPFAEFRQACTGFINALLFAAGLLATKPHARIAIVGSEVGSLFFDPLRAKTDIGQLVNLVQMGDGAAAVIVGTAQPDTPQITNLFHGQIGTRYPSGLCLTPGSASNVMPAFDIAEFDHDFSSIQAHGLELFSHGLAAAHHAGVDAQRCRFILPHQANGKMDAALAELLPGHAGILTHGKTVGNTGSAAIWLALDRARRHMQHSETMLVLGAESTQYMYGGFLYAA